MNFSLEQLKMALNFLPIDEKIKESIINSSEVLLEFRVFFAKKHGLSEKEADKKIQSILNIQLKSENISETIKNAVDSSYNLALSEGFEKADLFRDAVASITDAMISVNK